MGRCTSESLYPLWIEFNYDPLSYSTSKLRSRGPIFFSSYQIVPIAIPYPTHSPSTAESHFPSVEHPRESYAYWTESLFDLVPYVDSEPKVFLP